MTKQEFLKVLQTSLNGKISDAQVADHLRYYEEYINNEIRSGRSEQDVMDSLGDPRLIARTIVMTEAPDGGTSGTQGGAGNGGYAGNGYTGSTGYGQGGYSGNGGYRQNGYGNQDNEQRNIKVTRVPAWIWLIAIILIVVLVVNAVFSVVSFLLPVLIPILFVVLMIKLFRDWLN